MSRNMAADDESYSDKNMKKARDVTGTFPGEFSPPSRETPFAPDPMAPPSDNRAALRYPYEPRDPSARRVR